MGCAGHAGAVCIIPDIGSSLSAGGARIAMASARAAASHSTLSWRRGQRTAAPDFTIGDEPFKAGFGCSRTSMYEFRL
ncbi:hypothetical protein JQK88_10095 [Mesorhizobium caraganae]|uniref:hypothetical protein n=1 Tax=Mesorhizobium caraganae TaxID=483206 RepID=UPI00193A1E96|nr:hypothetical protein [Mesorhizobium caraganae]MBM2711598.1 hypothetical protein [Mesorhizobium caraganae]